MTDESIVKLTDLKVNYNKQKIQTEVLDIPEFKLTRHSEAVLLAQSGSGKTTLLNVISGLFAPQNGQVSINKTNI
ncbi:ATP-binding cassette domain-containing protein [Natranaerobius trueperi]|uniref:ABC transporter domain-containing protein n=1 Tax=Natranaerobius trueperi TaxID=759412 RepID=A0A226C1Y0_9FIRM|nr:ATP-binding cassette domain-containing protein [Natranaerobius trueperi]OWZ84417.1 hypothetical protein CDO51_03905 [Natranaerobius trueperi]